MQPNLYGFQIPYLLRDEVKHFLRAFFNSFAVAFYPDTRMLTEHPAPTMADWSGDHYKTSDEAIFCYCLRLTLVYENKENLLLMPVVPRRWLEDGKQIEVEDAVTYFGLLSFKVQSNVCNGFIKMDLTPPTEKPPKSVSVRFRHPEGLKIRRVQVNGKDWNNFDTEKELVKLGHIEKPVQVAVHY